MAGRRAAAANALSRLNSLFGRPEDAPGLYPFDSDDDLIDEEGEGSDNITANIDQGSSEEDAEANESDTDGAATSSENFDSKNGLTWKRIDELPPIRQPPERNILRNEPGPKSFIRRKVDDELTAWSLLFDQTMLRKICVNTNDWVVYKGIADWQELTVEDLKSFIGILYIRGIFGYRNADVRSMWSKDFGIPLVSRIMSRNRFIMILANIRFDNPNERSQRLNTDKFTHIRELVNSFVKNSISAYTPSALLTIDEQLLPMKNRCSFIQFIKSKPDKFGIKLWLLVDCVTKYILNYFPYIGKEERNGRLSDAVVAELMEPYLRNGHNVTADNYFTTVNQMQELLQKNTTYVGTVRMNSKDLCKDMKDPRPLYHSQFYQLEQDNRIIAVSYQCKSTRKVVLFSSMHEEVNVDSSERKKPNIVLTYNSTKTGVDIADAMLRMYSCKAATRRWPIGVFYDLLDKCAINSWILHKQCTNSSATRKKYILNLIFQIVGTSSDIPSFPSSSRDTQATQSKKRKRCSITGCENKTSFTCNTCEKNICGKHSQKLSIWETCIS